MLLTKTEQEELRSFIITYMKIMHEKIINMLDDSDLENETSNDFISCLFKEKYHTAFDYCINWNTIRYELDFMNIVEQIVMPSVVFQMSYYHVFEADKDSERFDLLDAEIIKQLNQLNDELFH